MRIEYDEFEAACPSAMAPDEGVFDAVQPFLQLQLDEIKGVVTADMFAKLEQGADPDLRKLCQAVKGWACCSAYAIAIPHLDLVLTSTGFGVVSNQNVAPASADRVRELRSEVSRQEGYWFESVLDMCRGRVDWAKSTHSWHDSLFWRSAHVRGFGIYNPTRKDLFDKMPSISSAETALAQLVSPELFKELLAGEANKSNDSFAGVAVTLWRRAAIAIATSDPSSAASTRSLLRFIEDNIGFFPAYHNSKTYEANNFKRYQNEKDDPCFFFG